MVSVTCGGDTTDEVCRGDTRCRAPSEVVPRLSVRAEADSAAGRATVGTLAMSLTNMAMTTSAAVVTTVSSQSIRRWRRRRLRRRAETLVWRTSVSQPGEGVPILPG